MQAGDDILNLLRKKGAESARKAQCGLILQPGAIGDCMLTLPLVGFMKECLGLGSVDILGHTEYIGILPGRTYADGIRSIDSVDLHRLFVEAKTFDLVDGDPLINVFAGYPWIVTFLGKPNSDFEQNLIFTANCSHSAEVITLPVKPPARFSAHVADFYIQEFAAQSGLALEPRRVCPNEVLIRATEADISRGRELLKETGVDGSKMLVVVQPGCGGLEKCWYLDNYLAVAKELCQRGIEVVFLLGPAELERFSDSAIKNICSVAKCVKELSLTQVLGLLSCTDRFIGNDCGITHLAAGLGVRTLAVFGPSDPEVYRPIGPAVAVYPSRAAGFAKKPSVTLQRKLLGALME